MGAGHKPLPPRRSKAMFVVPVLLCLTILWQTRQQVSLLLMYGTVGVSIMWADSHAADCAWHGCRQ
jgi:hypothetical protein